MKLQKNYKFWFCTGSQDLYGEECLSHVAAHSKEIVAALNASGILPYEVVWKPTLITNELIRKTFNEANTDDECAGVITWMHTFSPAKSWILGLQELRKPLLHLHTQYNMEIPYDTIDMDFMNENQGRTRRSRVRSYCDQNADSEKSGSRALDGKRSAGKNCFLAAHRCRHHREQPYPRYACR